MARLDPIKNQAMLIKAFKEINRKFSDTFLVLVGDGQLREDLEVIIKKMELSSNVLITGFQKNVHLYYQVMDIFLLPSFSEGTAMTLLEAMASGTPCVATNVGGNPEIVKNRETGLITENDNKEDLVEKVSLLLNDKNLVIQMGIAGRKRFEQNFSVKKMVQAYEILYEKILEPV